MLNRAIKFLLTAMLSSIILGFLAYKFTSNEALLVLAYSSGVAIAFLFFHGTETIKFEGKKSAIFWLFAACLLPICYVAVTYFIDLYFFHGPVPEFSLSFLTTMPFVIIASFFEEIGWRGFSFKLLEKFSWVKMNFVIGFLWAFWHFPAIFFNNHSFLSLLFPLMIFTINLILLSFIFAWLRQKSCGIIAPTLLHSFHNLSYAFFYGQNSVLPNETNLVLTFVLIIFCLILKSWKDPRYK